MSQKKIKELKKLQVKSDVTFDDWKDKLFGFRKIIKDSWKFLLILSLGLFVIYFNSLNGDFVSDDYAGITQEPNIKNFSFVLNQKNTQALTNWFLAVTFGIESPIPYHVASLFFYILVCVLAFILIYLLFDKKTAYLTTVLFAVLPTHAENVSWISGRPYLFVAIFVFFSLNATILFLKTKNKKYLIYCLTSLVLLFFSDPIRGFAFPLLLSLIAISFKKELNIKYSLGKIFLGLIVVGFLLMVVSWPMINARISAVNSGYNGSGGIFYDPFFQYPTAITKYLQLMLVPIDLTLYHTMYTFPLWLNWSILLFYLTAVGYFFFKDKKIFFALAFIFVATAPSMAPAKVSWLVAERYILMGSLGFSLFLVLFFQKFSKKWEVPFFILFSFLIILYSARVVWRNVDWQTNHNLWVSSCQVSPNSHNAWNNIGDDYDKLAQLETNDEARMKHYLNSIKGFTRSTIMKNNYADAFHNRANIFYKIGRYDLARDSYETALYFGPSLYQSYLSLLQIDLLEGRFDLAMEHLERLHQARPNDAQVFYVTAVIYANMGRIEEATQILEDIIRAIPNYTDAINLLNQIKSLK